MSGAWKPKAMRESGSGPTNRFAVLGEEESERPMAAAMPPAAPARAAASAVPPLPKTIPGAAGGAGTEAAPAPIRFGDRLRQTGGAKPVGARAPLPAPKLDSETEFPTLGGGAGAGRRPAVERSHATPRPTYTVGATTFAESSAAGSGGQRLAGRIGTASFADKAREAAAREAQEDEERAAAEAHWRAEREREAYERSLLVARFSGLSFHAQDDTAARAAAYEEEDKLRGMQVAPVEETAWRPGTPPYPPTSYIPGVDGPAEEHKDSWDAGAEAQEEAW